MIATRFCSTSVIFYLHPSSNSSRTFIMQSNVPSTSNQCVDTWIPDGFVSVVGANNNKYIVPEYIVPALQQQYQAAERKEKLGAFKAPGTVSKQNLIIAPGTIRDCMLGYGL
jgi:hypothetical protein